MNIHEYLEYLEYFFDTLVGLLLHLLLELAALTFHVVSELVSWRVRNCMIGFVGLSFRSK